MDFPGLARRTGCASPARVGFRKFANTGYYGFGNDSKATNPRPRRGPRRLSGRATASTSSTTSIRCCSPTPASSCGTARRRRQRRRIEALVGVNATYNIVRPYEHSKLAQDIAALDDGTQDAQTLGNFLRGTDPRMLLVFNLGLLFDTRDHEFTPTRGTFTELSVRSSPGVQQDLRYAGASR
jgi:hypothetical protein